MRHSYLCVGLLSCVAGSSVFAEEITTDTAETTNVTNTSKTKQLAHVALAKSFEVAKKLAVNANAAQDDAQKDPFESFNRKIFAFNEVLDNHVARPLAIQYVEKVPSEVRGSYRQFRKNLSEPWNAINQLVQGRPARAATTVGRFTVNTLTTLGFADPARRLNLSSESEGFGITMGYYGIPSGAYLVLPIFGPSTVREGVGFAVDTQARPQKYLLEDHDGAYWSEQLLRGVDARSQFLELESTLQGDKYAQIRDFYLQRINFAVTEKKGITEENLFISDDDFDEDPSTENQKDSSSDHDIPNTDNSITK